MDGVAASPTKMIYSLENYKQIWLEKSKIFCGAITDLILSDLDGAGGQRAEVGGEAGAALSVPHVAPPQRRRRGRRRGGGDDGDGAAARALLVVPDHLGWHRKE